MSDRRIHLCVDRDRCEGHGQCTFAAPDLLHLDEDGHLVIDQSDVTACAEIAQRAVSACPTSALRLEPMQ